MAIPAIKIVSFGYESCGKSKNGGIFRRFSWFVPIGTNSSRFYRLPANNQGQQSRSNSPMTP